MHEFFLHTVEEIVGVAKYPNAVAGVEMPAKYPVISEVVFLLPPVNNIQQIFPTHTG